MRNRAGSLDTARSRVREDGFTIIEALTAAAVLATSLVALAHVVAVATLATARARDVTRATLIAAQKLEELRAAAWAAGPVDAEDIIDQRFRRRWSIMPLAPGSAVAIVVEVTPSNGHVPPVRFETLRARPGSGGEP